MTKPAISIVIPAYNEEAVLPDHFDNLIPLLEELFPGSWEIIVVDDGSTDRTAQVVVEMRHQAIRLLSPGVNRGKGAALRDGVLASTGNLMLMCDADMATPPSMLRPFLAALHTDVDIVIGNRRSAESRIERKQSLPRRILGRVYNRLAIFLVGVDVADINCGFKLFRGKIARELFAYSTTAEWAIDLEILALASRRKCKIAEVPVVWRDGDKSSVRIVRDMMKTLCQMIQLFFRLRH